MVNCDEKDKEKMKEKLRNISVLKRSEADSFLDWLKKNIKLEFSQEDRSGVKFIQEEKALKKESIIGVMVPLRYILFWLANTWKGFW